MKRIPLTQGKYAIVDDKDYQVLSGFNWSLTHYGYAHRGIYKQGKHIIVWMHRVVIGAKKGQYVDHINGNKLDNRRENLRLCNYAQNTRNTKMRSTNTSGYRGVYFFPYDTRKKRWYAAITYNYKYIKLGYFDTAKEAALAYDNASREYHGEFGRRNFA